ncbi:MAG: hypothetical protein V4731_15510 [Pseudomonadota bacterium]
MLFILGFDRQRFFMTRWCRHLWTFGLTLGVGLCTGVLPHAHAAGELVFRPHVLIADFEGDAQLAAKVKEELASRLKGSQWLEAEPVPLLIKASDPTPMHAKLGKYAEYYAPYVLTATVTLQADNRVHVKTELWWRKPNGKDGRILTAPIDKLGELARVMADFLHRSIGDPKIGGAANLDNESFGQVQLPANSRGASEYVGQQIGGKPVGLGRRTYADGVVTGQWMQYGTEFYPNGLVVEENHKTKTVKIGYAGSSTGCCLMGVELRSDQLAGPRGCNGFFPEWVIIKGRCTPSGPQKDSTGSLLMLNAVTLDNYRALENDEYQYQMTREGVALTGKVRAPFEFVRAEVTVPWTTGTGYGRVKRVEYSGTMVGLTMHGEGQCRSTGTAMEPCLMQMGRRVR